MRYVPENIDPLEDELRSFRPAEPSRELLERVGWQLASDRARPVWPWLAGADLPLDRLLSESPALAVEPLSPARSERPPPEQPSLL